MALVLSSKVVKEETDHIITYPERPGANYPYSRSRQYRAIYEVK
jgi:hypothetical protein